MKAWEMYAELTSLIENIDHSAPAGFSTEKAEGWFEAMFAVEVNLRNLRKPYEDILYAEYVKRSQTPWCDECGTQVRLDEPFGWKHVNGGMDGHYISMKEYHWGWEAMIQKRLRFEI